MKAEARAVGAGALMLGLILGCQASVNADANVSGSADGDANGSAPASADGQVEGRGEMARQQTDTEVAANIAPGSTAALVATDLPSSRVLLGARHDLKLRPGKQTASCGCLAVALGSARSNGMAWSAVPPSLDDTTQLSLALSSDGIECKGEPKGSLGASYWGYRIAGNDVVVLVEAARGGRPLTTGAVIPKPVGAGQVFVAPASKKLPYGRSLEGKGLCKVGNPGQVRAGGFTELELGVDAPARRAVSDADSPSSSDTPMTIELPTN